MIDILVAIILAFAFLKGGSKGLIMSIFSFVGLIIGLVTAMKCSVLLTNFFSENGIVGRWVTFLSFILIMFGVAMIWRKAAKILEKSLAFIFLGWMNKLGGIILYALIHLTVLSVILFYVSKIGLLSDGALAKSIAYPYIQPLGPFFIDNIGNVIPIFKGMFQELNRFFDTVVPVQ